MESYEVVEWFERMWPTVAKNRVLTNKSSSLLAVFFRVGGVRGYLDLRIGPQGGIKETAVIIDPVQRVIADRLLVKSTDGGEAKTGLLVFLTDLRSKTYRAPRDQRRATAIALCVEALDAFIQEVERSALEESFLRNLPSTSASITGVYSGGLPGHGPDRGAGGH